MNSSQITINSSLNTVSSSTSTYNIQIHPEKLNSLSLASILKTRGHLGGPHVHRSQRRLCIGQKNGFWIYDGEVLKQSVQVSFFYLKHFIDRKAPILVINKEDSLKEVVKVFCGVLGLYHMQEKWMGGLLTNWGQAEKQRTHFLKVQDSHGKFFEKTKDRAYLKVKNRFKGLERMPGRPALCIIMDLQESEFAFKEALKLKIPVMAFVNTDDNLDGVNFPIFGSNKSLPWIRWVFNAFLYWYGGEGLKTKKKDTNHETS